MSSKPAGIMPAKHRGFTFIELLVVIAIIAILAAMLLPGMSGAIGGGARQFMTSAGVGPQVGGKDWHWLRDRSTYRE